MAEIIGAELQTDRFISGDPENGVLAVIDSNGDAQNIVTYDQATGDVTLDAPAGSGTNTRRIVIPRGQLKFPATQVPSTDPNTLDDYEEGTFTPTIGAGFTSPTFTTQNGIYRKVGGLVTFSLQLNPSGGTLNGSQFQINGLPFLAAATHLHGVSWGYASQVVASGPLPLGLILAGSTSIIFYTTTGATFNGTSFQSNTPNMVISGSYSV